MFKKWNKIRKIKKKMVITRNLKRQKRIRSRSRKLLKMKMMILI